MTTVTIQARDFWTDVCPVRAGETYRLTAAGRWRDWFVRCGPAGYSTVLLAPLAHRRRAPDAAWFCLMGAIDRDEPSAFPIGAGRTWTAPKSGLLACFANDLPKMYWNNRDAITLTVERLAVGS